MVFLFDDSSSISHNSPGNFQIMKNFMKKIVNSFETVGPSGAQFGAVMFSDRVDGPFHLNTFSTKAAITQGVQDIIPKEGGSTAIGAGIEVIRGWCNL